MLELYKRIMTRHGSMTAVLRDVAAMQVQQGQDIEDLSALLEAWTAPPIVDNNDATPPDEADCETIQRKHGSKTRNDRTAVEWATSPAFVQYVMRALPFSAWSAEKQNAMRDAFATKHAGNEETKARWGKSFASFCHVIEAQ